mmetsp:Transcript_38841/g.79193  ORF Transcript_38841/g.79193 Transcript_38841/m.79193 type:complete len:172 (+) Transcript_38841:341-856(+)
MHPNSCRVTSWTGSLIKRTNSHREAGGGKGEYHNKERELGTLRGLRKDSALPKCGIDGKKWFGAQFIDPTTLRCFISSVCSLSCTIEGAINHGHMHWLTPLCADICLLVKSYLSEFSALIWKRVPVFLPSFHQKKLLHSACKTHASSSLVSSCTISTSLSVSHVEAFTHNR